MSRRFDRPTALLASLAAALFVLLLVLAALRGVRVYGSGPSARLIVSRNDAAGRPRFELVEAPRGWSVARAAAALRTDPGVSLVEPDRLMAPAWVPNDPYYGYQWHLPKIGAPAAWDATTGNPAIVVAVLDSGVNPIAELAPSLVPGFNFYNNTTDTKDATSFGHGTTVAGTIVAQGNNGRSVAGLAWSCKLMPIRISDSQGYAYWSTVANALVWAADHGARVASISYQCSDSAAIQSAARYFESRGGVVIASGGNAGQVLSTANPAEILTVGATDRSDAVPSWSNQGKIIDLSAPGVAIYTTGPDGSLWVCSGTSFSAPITAGAAALVLSINPTLSPSRVRQILTSSADDRGPVGWDPKYGAGRLNVGRALGQALGLP